MGCTERRDPKAVDFVTTGPFNQEELRDQLNAGEISYSDYRGKMVLLNGAELVHWKNSIRARGVSLYLMLLLQH